MTDRAGIPRAPGSFPLIGHAPSLLRAPLPFLSSLASHGTLVEVKIGPMAALVVCNAQLTRQVLLNDKVFDKGGLLYDRVREGFGNGLALCPHASHRRQRRLIQPVFNRGSLGQYADTMTETIYSTIDRWADGQTIDVLAEMQEVTARTIVASILGQNFTEDELSLMLRDFGTLSRGSYRRMFLPPSMGKLPTPGNRSYHAARARLRQALTEAVHARRAGTTARKDLLTALLESSQEGETLTDDEVVDQAMIFFFAGMESTAATLAWSLHLMAAQPDIEGALHKEVDAVLAGRPAAGHCLKELAYTHNIITETLRLYPPGSLFTRVTTTRTDLGGHEIERGTTIICSPYLIHHQPENFPSPDVFDPNRWNETPRTEAERATFIPFGGGPRKCIGDNFGMMQAVIALAAIASRWKLTLVPGAKVRAGVRTVINPQGLLMTAVSR
ncbi:MULTISPECIES: cytochrome P450 [unclassified Streptomyces]|uniref:cytochrome P450 n=1 Tax=unclassified Streptomyces TaxID=2593676 RepID=UPI0024762238|nr:MULTISPECIES: cytochrome P450 [unclassified Streptomyces]MDH6448696.1 cytochrome P450 [Streptomyces sp. SAI-119]MDH6500723.1 cytochrome P450 [Streptomyces sp. SAI-149]